MNCFPFKGHDGHCSSKLNLAQYDNNGQYSVYYGNPLIMRLRWSYNYNN